MNIVKYILSSNQHLTDKYLTIEHHRKRHDKFTLIDFCTRTLLLIQKGIFR